MAPCTCLSLLDEKYDQLAANWFQECLFSWEERVSFYVGMTSILFWILCQLPQFVKNYKEKSAEGLATFLLVQWLCGDTMNLFGSVLTRQLAFQKLSAGLFVIMDIGMISQKFMYAKKKPLLSRTIEVRQTHPVIVVSIAMLVMSQTVVATTMDDLVLDLIPSCEPHVDVAESSLLIGNILGWISSCLYVGSRIAQIARNRARQSTEGIASTMFLFAIMGNLTYSIGILLRTDHLIKAIPWLAGSLTCMTLDIFIVSQMQHYSHKRYRDLLVAREGNEPLLSSTTTAISE